MRRRRSVLAALAGIVAGAAAASPAPAQEVRGRVVDDVTRQPVVGGIVALLDSTGHPAAAALSDDGGAYLLRAPAAGRYTIRVERVGFRSTLLPPVDLHLGETIELPVSVRAATVTLGAVKVTADRRCLVRPQEGAVAAQLWDEARKALDATRLSRAQRSYAVRIRHTERDLDPRTLLPRRAEQWEEEGQAIRPFASVPAEQLARAGFVVAGADGSATYYGPDAEVLVSNEFLDGHCFRVQAPSARGEPDSASLVGLAFEPLSSRHLPDVRGVLWIDRASAELRALVFQYVNVETDVPVDQTGGRVELRRLPDGRWIVSRWYLRMPERESVLQITDPLGRSGPVRRTRLSGIREVGGEVVSVGSADDAARRAATLSGAVWDSLRAQPLAGARVFLSGTSYAATSDERGEFRMSGVAPGMYKLSFLHPRLDSLLQVAPAMTLALSAGQSARATLGLPSYVPFVTALCAGASVEDTTAAVVGIVRDPAGAPLAGATVSASWQRIGQFGRGDLSAVPMSLLATTAPDGRFALCGLPPDRVLQLRARQADVVGAPRDLPTRKREVQRADLVLPRR